MKNIDYYINHVNLASIFTELIKPKYGNEFKVKFQEFADQIKSDIETASVDYTCSCVSRVKTYINLNKEKSANFLYSYCEESDRLILLETISTDLEKPPENSKPVIDYKGKVAKTTLNDWPTFYKTIQTESGVFRSFSVVKEGEDIYVFFL
jgi:hypothetical protein